MAIYGYARVSTRDQNVDRQIDALKAFPLAEQDSYIDYFTGATFERPRYQELLGCLRAGDVLVVRMRCGHGCSPARSTRGSGTACRR